MSYKARLLSHLITYRRATLGVHESGIFNYRGREVPFEHILPKEHEDLNLLPLARQMAPVLLAKYPEVSRHKYFHHLNSSQAFAFNLFIPFFEGGQEGAAALLRALGQDAHLRSWQPEAVPDKDEGSNLDALWNTDAGVTTICEVKLSEAEFGQAKDDIRHRNKLNRIYQPVLQGNVDPVLLTLPAFLGAYQVLRNIWHLVRHDCNRLIFLLPRENAPLWKAVTPILNGVAPEVRQRIGLVAIEDALADLCLDMNCPAHLQVYAHELIAKYVP